MRAPLDGGACGLGESTWAMRLRPWGYYLALARNLGGLETRESLARED